MKKLATTIVTKKGETKIVYVNVDDETARVLEEANDEYFRRIYLEEKYKCQKIDRKETRRHISLEYLYEQGIDFETDPIENFEKQIDIKEGISDLTSSQREVINLYFFEDKTQEQIAQIYGISESVVRCRLKKIYAQLRKNKKFD
jgi:RNA polymerase sigma factor (sigma-70 family)